jgi:hypothetical protein
MGDTLPDFLFWALGHPQAEPHILLDRHMRIESICLKHHCHSAVRRIDLVHLAVADPDFPLARLFEAGNDTQKGGFTAARRPYEDYEFTIIYLKADSMKDLGLAESLNNILEF